MRPERARPESLPPIFLIFRAGTARTDRPRAIPFATEVNSVVTKARFTPAVRALSSKATIGPNMEKPEDRRLNPAVVG